MKKLLTLALLIGSTSSYAGNIRDIPLPNAANVLSSMGYTEFEVKEMEANPDSIYWTQETGWKESTERLQEAMMKLASPDGEWEGWYLNDANTIINMCKAYARDARHCVVFASTVGCTESSCGKYHYKNSIFGVVGETYSSKAKAIKAWVDKYNNVDNLPYKGWYVANEGSSDWYSYCESPRTGVWRYSNCRDENGVLKDIEMRDFYNDQKEAYDNGDDDDNPRPRFNYCMSETDTNIWGYCPNGLNNANTFYARIMSVLR
ncbi:hypothetical protein [Pseudoalteromonas sp. S2755]|uniref:hypothetical protein n=1 Tax=Pseudoalteromonas sp. S2755 TaxID=2066523 RepID=UPI00110ADEA4|nr:hypothetical protein [Pseudoalteromonas sp. S2755]TMN38822.1 hypothetical protein CWC03_10770 [Pseudoalteromonas sp. S2755]